jgi:ribosome-binding protein aMBF1 (putative translation factor)
MKKKPKTKSVHGFFRKKFQESGFAKAHEDASPLMDVALAIVEARNKSGLSQAELAKKLSTTQSVISRIENGNQNLSVKILAKIAQILSCDLTVILRPHRMAA